MSKLPGKLWFPQLGGRVLSCTSPGMPSVELDKELSSRTWRRYGQYGQDACSSEAKNTAPSAAQTHYCMAN